MKSKSRIIVTIWLWIVMMSPVIGQEFNIMTYNIRYDNPNDGINSWEKRKPYVVNLIQKYQPAIIGIQEGLINQVQYLDNCLVNFAYIGVGREDGKQKGEFSAIFYDSTEFEILKHATFWLSKTSDTVSIGWDATLERICTFGLFEHKTTGKKFWVFNTHFDHIGKKARKNSAKLIVEKIKGLNKENYPVILTGDLNTEPDSRPVKILENNLQRTEERSVSKPQGPTGTFTGFVSGATADRQIDYVFVNGFAVLNYNHIDDRRNGNLYISDHLPVLATLHAGTN